MNEKNYLNKKAQLTILIIFALIIIVLIAIFAFYIKSANYEKKSIRENPRDYLSKCLASSIEYSLREFLKEPILNDNSIILYDNTKINVICDSSIKNTACENKYPALKKNIEDKIKYMSQSKIDKCYEKIKENLQKYDYYEKRGNLEVEIIPQKIIIKDYSSISFKVNEQTSTIELFEYSFNSEMYGILSILNEISNKESSCLCSKETCGPDLFELNSLKKGFKIEKFAGSKNEDAYTITNKESKETLSFGVRSCTI
jgi:hypothetical protein